MESPKPKLTIHPLSGMAPVFLKGDERKFEPSELLKKRMAWKKKAKRNYIPPAIVDKNNAWVEKKNREYAESLSKP